MTPRCVVDGRNVLGESAVWDWRADRFLWVDIEGAALFRLDPATALVERHPMPERIGALALRGAGGLVLALASGFAFYDPATMELERLPSPDPGPGNRFNDARCDRAGRLWAGAMTEGDGRRASLYRLDPDLTWHEARSGIGTSNSICVSPDGRLLYFADSRDPTIHVHDLSADGRLSAPRPFAASPAIPDGSTVDAEGCLWNACWNDGSVIRYRPDGRVDRRIALPVRKPTSCAFGGPELRTLFVTSATWDLTPAERAGQPRAGGVFAIDLDVPGLPEPTFAG